MRWGNAPFLFSVRFKALCKHKNSRIIYLIIFKLSVYFLKLTNNVSPHGLGKFPGVTGGCGRTVYLAKFSFNVETMAQIVPFYPSVVDVHPNHHRVLNGILIVQGSPPNFAFICTTTFVAMDMRPLRLRSLPQSIARGLANKHK